MNNMFGDNSILNRGGSLVPSDFKVTVAIDMESGIKFGLVIFLFVMMAVALGSAIGKKMA